MAAPRLPLIIETKQLHAHLRDDKLLVVDLGKFAAYNEAHVPGAVHLPYSCIVRAEQPAMGLLPTPEQLSRVFGQLGLTPDTHVVAYDHEAGGRASRLLWTLDIIGHRHRSLLNGGIHAWVNDGHHAEAGINEPHTREYNAEIVHPELIADKRYLLEHLHDPEVVLLDTRSANEFSGEDKRAERGGHIPGAVNLETLLTMDGGNHLRLLPDDKLKDMLGRLGVTPDKEIIVYCQTHHRSAHTYVLLKHLGYPRVRGYDGSWSEWGNDLSLPIEN